MTFGLFIKLPLSLIFFLLIPKEASLRYSKYLNLVLINSASYVMSTTKILRFENQFMIFCPALDTSVHTLPLQPWMTGMFPVFPDSYSLYLYLVSY